MPACERSTCASAATSSVRSRLIAEKNGAAWPEVMLGLALCASTQIEQEADSVRLGWVWTDSTAAVHNIKDRQSQVDHFTQVRICGSKADRDAPRAPRNSCFGLDSFELILVIQSQAREGKLL